MPTDHDIVAISNEVPVPEDPKRKDKKWRNHPRKGAMTKRGPSRPYRRITEEILSIRIQKLTTRMERSKKQHEDSRQLLTKYSHEKTYRLRESLAQEAASETSPLPTFDAVDSAIAEAPLA